MTKSKILKCLSVVLLVSSLLGCQTPTTLEIVPDKVVLEGSGATKKLEAKVLDGSGEVMKEGYEVLWFTEDLKIIKLNPDGEIEALASGEAKVEAEIVGTELKAKVPVRVKIPSSINISHEKLRLSAVLSVAARLMTSPTPDTEALAEKDRTTGSKLPSTSSATTAKWKIPPPVRPESVTR